MVGEEDPGGNSEADSALTYLQELNDETMTLAWGPDRSPEECRRIVLAAMIFGRQFEERMREHPPKDLEEQELQRFLMSLMDAVISEFAKQEELDDATATAFLSDVKTRDYVLEFNEVLEECATNPEKPLNEHLRTAVESRQERAAWSNHWSSS